MTYEIHPAADCFPMMSDDELAGLADDIKTNGLQRPVELLGNLVIDGRNRLRACELAGIAPQYQEIRTADPVRYVVSANIQRRHLTTAQRAAIAADLATMAFGSNPGKGHIKCEGGPNDPLIETPALSIEQAATLMNVSPKSVKNAKATKRQGLTGHPVFQALGQETSARRRALSKSHWAPGLSGARTLL